MGMKVIYGFKPLFVCEQYVLWSKGYAIFVSDNDAINFDWICDVPSGKIISLFSRIRILQRLMRLEVFPAAQLEHHTFIVATRGKLWRLSVENKKINFEHSLRVGTRPLSFVRLEQSALYPSGVYFGEYSENIEREGVRIYQRSNEGTWRSVYEFPSGAIAHIHSLVQNPETGEVWVLTGDMNGESGFWVIDSEFISVRPLLIGSQEYRAAWMCWRGGKAYYATDSQCQQNSFRALVNDGEGWKATSLVATCGPSIYSAKTKKWLAFSTAVEPLASSKNSLRDLFDRKPAPGIVGDDSCIYLLNQQNELDVIFRGRKDWLPPTLFQFGTVIFPDYNFEDSDYLYCYCIALEGYDGCTLIKQVA